jgi:hypothetical protein
VGAERGRERAGSVQRKSHSISATHKRTLGDATEKAGVGGTVAQPFYWKHNGSTTAGRCLPRKIPRRCKAVGPFALARSRHQSDTSFGIFILHLPTVITIDFHECSAWDGHTTASSWAQ